MLIRTLLIACLTLPLVILFLSNGRLLDNPMATIFTLIPFFITVWIYYGTYYVVEKDMLFYKSAFLGRKIEISKISEIIKGETSWTGVKPATATEGLLIKFNAYEEIYISPENNDSFIEALTSINNKIAVKG